MHRATGLDLRYMLLDENNKVTFNNCMLQMSSIWDYSFRIYESLTSTEHRIANLTTTVA